MKKIIVFLLFYVLTLLVGFRLGETHNRIKNRVKVEKIQIPVKEEELYYIVEERNADGESFFTFDKVADTNIHLCFLFNEKLKPLLKLKKIQIYNKKGEQIY